MSTTEDIASVFYLRSLDSADVLAVKVHFKKCTVSETDYKKLPEKKSITRSRLVFINNRYLLYTRISLCNDDAGMFCACCLML